MVVGIPGEDISQGEGAFVEGEDLEQEVVGPVQHSLVKMEAVQGNQDPEQDRHPVQDPVEMVLHRLRLVPDHEQALQEVCAQGHRKEPAQHQGGSPQQHRGIEGGQGALDQYLGHGGVADDVQHESGGEQNHANPGPGRDELQALGLPCLLPQPQQLPDPAHADQGNDAGDDVRHPAQEQLGGQQLGNFVEAEEDPQEVQAGASPERHELRQQDEQGNQQEQDQEDGPEARRIGVEE